MTDELKINGVQVTITHVPFRCVVCNGFGTLRHGSKQCQACHGTGYVVIEQSINTYEQSEYGNDEVEVG